MEFFQYFIGRVRDFTNDFQKILKVLLKKILIYEIFFFKFCGLLFVFLFFVLFLTFYIPFRLSVLAKKFQKFLGFIILWVRDFIKEFWKIIEYFSKKYTYLKSKILHKFHCLLFVYFYIFSILVIFFSYFTYPNLSKNSEHFCGALLYGLQILSENSEKFLNFYQKNRNTLNTKHFQNSIVYYLLF